MRWTFIKMGNFLENFLSFFKGLWKNRRIISELAASDLRSRNLGSFLGFFWVFLNPFLSILVIWAVFEFGIREQSGATSRPIVWILTGLIAWQVIAEAIGSGTTSIMERPYLVKKIKFDTELLPVIKVINSIKVHILFVGFACCVALFHRQLSLLSLLQLPYYFLCLSFMLTAFCILFSSLAVFYRDAQNLIMFLVQLGFWGTPILWDSQILERYGASWVLAFNPIHYVIHGYRTSVIGGDWFWSHPLTALVFWMQILILFIFSRWVFKKLQPSFSDVM